jgi:hypothetical protein
MSSCCTPSGCEKKKPRDATDEMSKPDKKRFQNMLGHYDDK